ncbi:MAG TPA: putative toxin-antitoxin system toxin component, PIN family [Pyrinomonadaceae bacterium]|nr:putative toxin-antitoxin system toxin component, PIN family [Pyrinomonadaceae bacterium]
MSQTLQIILDTNILIAAFRSKRGAANLLLDKLNDSRWQVNVSTPLLLEYEDVLKRSEMNDFISAANADIFLDGLCAIAENHDIFFLWRLLAKDPNDAFILELAVRVNADFIITYNAKDFPAAADFGIKLATPKEFPEFVGNL